MLIDVEKSTLLLVDFQSRLMPAIHQGETVTAQAVRLGRIAQLVNVPIIGTEQSPTKLGGNEDAIKQLCQTTVSKIHFNACADGLLGILPRPRRQIIIAGCEAHICMLQTALGLLAHGFVVRVVVDAVGSRRESDRDAALARLQQAGAQLVTVEMVAYEWVRDSEHPAFRQLLPLIK
ncbi:isochorismatase family protein [Glaciimonas sp. Gout2]|uniref:isochorismatase family protein n=1 Tax=unclassified Glaciimonas TaxID=2644401 RepID=UPI002B229655|nr:MULTISPECIES: isochorismatase family protein [unclassified Glaciimonas]MEB0011687.1 isochorismatase family protein [Glaciimonas sp. Cout2]MEB0080757.1 isochorismatase family protein [Glaciimonas sp. Gout2]